MTPEDITNRFSYHAPDAEKRARHGLVRGSCEILAAALDDLIPDGREKSLAMTNLEQAMFWANAALARQA